MKQNSKKTIYDLAKRFRYGLLTKTEVEMLAEKDREDIFYQRLGEEMDDVWRELEESGLNIEELEKDNNEVIVPSRKLSKIKYLIVGVASVAAAIVLIFTVFPLQNEGQENVSSMSIAEFAQESRNTTQDDIKETQLILSESETILLGQNNKESQVVYDDKNVTVEEKVLTKEKISSFNQIVTAKGKRSQLTLSDGTKVWINSSTRVVYPTQFAEDVREIYVDGEIYIEVAKEPSRQFRVKTKDFSVQVLGTKFNVSSYENSLVREVVLVEGKVAVKKDETATSSIIMNPNELLDLRNSEEKVRKVNPMRYTSWTQGLYYLERETLGQVVTFLSQYYGVNIQCDPEIVGMYCSGKIDLKEDIDEIFKILFTSYKLSYVKQGDTYYISKK